MEKRTRRIGWTVLFLGMALWIIVRNPWTTVRTRKCRDCLILERTTGRFMELSKSTDRERGEFADWFDAENPNHQHQWWNIGYTGSGFVRVHKNYVHGQFSLLHPKELLLLATKSPADYQTYRKMILSDDHRTNNEAVDFAKEAAMKMVLGESPENAGAQ